MAKFLEEDGRCRRLYSDLLKAGGEVEQSRARCEFLEECSKAEIIPDKCKVRMVSKQSQTKIIRDQRIRIVKEASMNELRVSLDDEKEVFSKCVNRVFVKL